MRPTGTTILMNGQPIVVDKFSFSQTSPWRHPDYGPQKLGYIEVSFDYNRDMSEWQQKKENRLYALCDGIEMDLREGVLSQMTVESSGGLLGHRYAYRFVFMRDKGQAKRHVESLKAELAKAEKELQSFD